MQGAPAIREREPAVLPRLAHPGCSWGWWDQVVLRAPGFPARGVERLAAPELAAAADAMAPAASEAEWDAFRRRFDHGMRDVARRLQEIAASPGFRRAVTWQNHRAVETALAPLLRWDADADARNSKHRQHEELVASYWQRYCVKNDSIAFFGPVGWGRIDPTAPRTRVTTGPGLVKRCEVFFEVWAVDRLAAALAADPEVRPWLRPRRASYVRVDGDSVLAPGPRARDLPPVEAEVLRACDGLTRAREIAPLVGRALARRGLDEDVDAAEVERILEQLQRRRWLTWNLDLPIVPRPERDLRRFLEEIADGEVSRRALSKLDALEAARAGVEDAAGDHDRLAAALAELDRTFVDLTDADATRREGRTYGGRTLAYLECRRDVAFELGEDVFEAAAPLSLLATSGRWLCFRLAEALRPRFAALHARLAGAGAAVPLSTYWFEALPLVRRGAREALETIQADFHDRWAGILDLPVDEPRVAYASEALGPRIRTAFDAPRPGWGGARYCSPDLLLAAPDLEHVHAGDFELVLGELHLAVNTQRHYCFVTQHPEPEALFAWVERDSPGPRLFSVLPKDSPPRLSIRTHPALIRPADYLVAHSHQTVPASRPRLVHSADALVVERDGALAVVLPDGETFDLLDVFSEMLMDAVLDRFRIVPARAHVPRITFDRLVVARETWRVDLDSLAFASSSSEARRYVEARAWRRELGLPERLFVSFGRGDKPFFVDFSSPVSVNVLARAVRRQAADGAARLTVTEMLPTLEQLWLTDAAGARYTAEFRLAGFDLLGNEDAVAA